MNIESSIKESMKRDVVLLVLPSEKYEQFLERIILSYSKEKSKLCLVSLNKKYSDFSEELKKKKIDSNNILFIDCISKKEGKAETKGNVSYVSSPGAYTEINIATKTALKAGVECVIFDSLSKLLIYGNHPIALKYIQDLIIFVRDNKKKISFMLLEDDYEKKVGEQIQMLVDKVITFGKLSKVAPTQVLQVKIDTMDLMEHLFGPQARKIAERHAHEKNPKLLLDEFKVVLSRLVGPENAQQQMEELYQKYTKR